jgi:hypothetical protein
MPERSKQDQKLAPFAVKTIKQVMNMMPRLIGGRDPLRPQVLALSKLMQAGPGDYKLTAAMTKARAEWDALQPGERELSDQQHDYLHHQRTHLLEVYSEHQAWDLIDVANFARDRPQRRHIKPTTLMKSHLQLWYDAPDSSTMLRVLKMNELMCAIADDEASGVHWPITGRETAFIECPPASSP